MYPGYFLRDVFLGRAGAAEDVAEHARGFGGQLDRPVMVVVAVLEPDALAALGPAAEDRRAWQDRFAHAWRQVTSAADSTIASVAFSREVVTLVPVDPTQGAGPAHLAVDRIVDAVRGDRGGGRIAFSAGVSRIAMGLADLPEAFRQAQRAVEIGRRVRGTGSTTFFDELGLHRLIALIPDAEELRAFTRDVLGPLTEQTTDAANLRETLQVLLDTNFNVAEAARLQFFHYNTMRYRVSKLERLLGPLSTDPHLRLDVAVALRVLEIAG
jgi:purine catabolism regulator